MKRLTKEECKKCYDLGYNFEQGQSHEKQMEFFRKMFPEDITWDWGYFCKGQRRKAWELSSERFRELKLDEFLDKYNTLCAEYGVEIWPQGYDVEIGLMCGDEYFELPPEKVE